MSRASQTRSTAPAREGARQARPREVRREADGAEPRREQRQASRRKPRPDRAAAVSHAEAARNWIPRRWPYLIITMIAAIGSGLVATRSLPSVPTVIMLGAALAGAAC